MTSAEMLLSDLFNGDTRALARVITRVENGTEDSLGILQKLFPRTGRARARCDGPAGHRVELHGEIKRGP